MPKSLKYVAGIVFLVTLFTPTEQAHFFWEKLPIFNVLCGFVGCITIIFVSKALGKLVIQRDEKYYD